MAGARLGTEGAEPKHGGHGLVPPSVMLCGVGLWVSCWGWGEAQL